MRDFASFLFLVLIFPHLFQHYDSGRASTSQQARTTAAVVQAFSSSYAGRRRIHSSVMNIEATAASVAAAAVAPTTDSLLTILPPETYESKSLPTSFAYPFCYQPHPIAVYAANQVKEDIQELSRTKWKLHNFGHPLPTTTDNSMNNNNTTTGSANDESAVGKMFGVLVVRTKNSELGYIKAYSGTLQGVTHSEDYGFCPMVYNRFDTTTNGDDGFDYGKEEAELNAMNRRIESLETNPELNRRRAILNEVKEQTTLRLAKARKEQKEQKKLRQQQRNEMMNQLTEEEYKNFEEELIQQSAAFQRHVKEVKATCQAQVQEAEESLEELESELQSAKQTRKNRSSELQNKLFDQYQFWNIGGKTKSLLPIFAATSLGRPPSGAGDCAAPKLFQYAFQKGYTPVALAEFWWGKSPMDEIRKHNFFYPACRGKCEPILQHMLQGMNIARSPLDDVGMDSSTINDLKVLYEDPYMVVVNKPNEMLSVPGRLQDHSVFSIMKERYPNATGPLLVHRLDMSTSGILIVAKDKDSHKALQSQFIDRTVKKRYTALLDGKVRSDLPKKGTINLPLCVDYLNRPMQKVDWENGKPAVTEYEIILQENNNDNDEVHDSSPDGTTRVLFYPVTGRTHQLRVHAAHSNGLDIPIVGDDIYGQQRQGQRLCLHAGYIELEHPRDSGKKMTFTSEAPF
eukprot:scaffold7064_cov111-Cylindrotheca_fusiformis.AAC.2